MSWKCASIDTRTSKFCNKPATHIVMGAALCEEHAEQQIKWAAEARGYVFPTAENRGVA